MTLVVVGELCADVIVPLDAEPRYGQHEQLVPSTTVTMGSSSAITACGAAALGVPTALVSVRGDDALGAMLDAMLRERGVSTAHVRVAPESATGVSTHLTRPDGDRAILTALGSIGETLPADVPALGAARHVHVGSWFLQRGLWGGGRALLERARAAGCTTSVDGNFDPDGEWDHGIRDLLGSVDVLFGNDEELCGIAGVAAPAEAVAALLVDMPAGAAVVRKLGAAGAEVHRAGAPALRAATPAIDGALVDTVGAGDTLAAGFLAALLAGDDDAAALALAVACGTASTRAAGGIGAQPSLAAAHALAATVTAVRRGE